MGKIKKGYSLGLIFTLIGVFLWSDLAYGLRLPLITSKTGKASKLSRTKTKSYFDGIDRFPALLYFLELGKSYFEPGQKKTPFRVSTDEEKVYLTERIGLFRTSGLIETIDDRDVQRAFTIVSSKNRPISSEEFRKQLYIMSKALAEKSLPSVSQDRTIVVLPWRGALGMALGFKEAGFSNFWNIRAKRDPKTLEVKFSYKGNLNFPKGVGTENVRVIIADQVMSTGGTILNIIELLKEEGIREENIIVCNVVSSIEGIARLFYKFPHIKMRNIFIDKKMDSNAWSLPSYGDAGDRFFENISKERLEELNVEGIITSGELVMLVAESIEQKLPRVKPREIDI